MSAVTVSNGRVVIRDGKVGTELECCCEQQCPCVCICPAFALSEYNFGPSPYGPIFIDGNPGAEAQANAILATIMSAQNKVLQGPTGNFTIEQRDCEGGGARVELIDDPSHYLWAGESAYFVFYPELIATCCGVIDLPGVLQWAYVGDEQQEIVFEGVYDSYETCTPSNDYPSPYTGVYPDCFGGIEGQRYPHNVVCPNVSQGDCVDGECNPLP